MSATLSSATPMTMPGGETVTPPLGAYTLQAVAYSSGTPSGQAVGDLLHIVLGPPGPKDLTTWQWAVERAGADAPCPDGFDPSWAQWPRDGAGGYVCVAVAERASPPSGTGRP
jgi:hypothetical protein